MKNMRDELTGLFNGAKDRAARDKIVIAEQRAIQYYYDVLGEYAATEAIGNGPMKPISMESAQIAVRAINQECANQKKPYLFNGQIHAMRDLFMFAAEIAIPGVTQKAGVTA